MFAGINTEQIKIRVKKNRYKSKYLSEELILSYFDVGKIYSATRYVYKDTRDNSILVTYMIRNGELPNCMETLGCNDAEFYMYFEKVEEK